MMDVVLYIQYFATYLIFVLFLLVSFEIFSKSLFCPVFDVNVMYFLLIHLKNHVEMSTFVNFLKKVISNEVSDE